ncbi:DUF3311 domain-containing protein [Halodesulfurarchaeum sp.]|uniref:DUF3311 domain-containing protein n=1 Tax=Halodesulfurarchaeum sp. TaxID=1980530 RepID=UPI001BBAACF0|nr:DUF3311 domain-containing protein [Halodesulfurarchaeum sp.]
MNRRSIGWALTFLGLVVFAIPWFLWGSDQVVAGLPLWLWWHIGWMALSAVVFQRFARQAWGLWITEESEAAAGLDTHGGQRR